MTKLYEVRYYLNADESGTLYKCTTTWEGLEHMADDKGIEVMDYKEVEDELNKETDQW